MPTTRALARRAPGGRTLLLLGVAMALALSMLVDAGASSHREAPLITEDPVADNTDVYAFVAPDAPNSVTLISNFVPFQEPGGGPNYYKFGDDVLYGIHIDNNGDAVADVTYEFRFTTRTVDPNTYLYATGPIESISDLADDDNGGWNRPQTYTVTKVANGTRTVIARDLRTPPVNVGPRTTPNYPALAQQAIHTLNPGGKVFAGQRDDGFFVDIASIFDLGGLRPLNEAHLIKQPTADGRDTLAGYNVHSIALQIPISQLDTQSHTIGVWSTTDRLNASVGGKVRQGWTQVSRLGNPLINEVIIPTNLKDAFNTLTPSQDAGALAGVTAPPLSTEGPIPLVTDPMLAEQIEVLYPGVTTPPAPRTDLVSVFLTGIQGVNQPKNVKPAEMLRLNTSVQPTPFGQQNRLGFLAGQNDGFPNGRRVGDDVLDIALRAVAGGYPLTPDFNKAPNNALTDGANANDLPYLTQFPYLAVPHQGYELDNPDRVTQG